MRLKQPIVVSPSKVVVPLNPEFMHPVPVLISAPRPSTPAPASARSSARFKLFVKAP